MSDGQSTQETPPVSARQTSLLRDDRGVRPVLWMTMRPDFLAWMNSKVANDSAYKPAGDGQNSNIKITVMKEVDMNGR